MLRVANNFNMTKIIRKTYFKIVFCFDFFLVCLSRVVPVDYLNSVELTYSGITTRYTRKIRQNNRQSNRGKIQQWMDLWIDK